MEKGQSLSKANKGMHRFVSGRSFTVLVVPILLSMLVFNHLKKKKKGTEKLSTLIISPIPTGGGEQYDVFLSFRGSDTCKRFTDHLYHRLVNAGIVPIFVFKDDNSLQIGKEFGSQLLNTVTWSKISIPIISENYASSKWCIRELIHIMECKNSMSHMVLPVFYKVDPSNVRHLKGNFGKAFDSHKKYLDVKDILEGQRALTAVSLLNGIESEKIANGHEGKLVEEVVDDVLIKLRRTSQLPVTKHLGVNISPEATDVGSSQCDVFLSFRGSDTRKAFTDHLYHRLINAGTVPICVFKDDNGIPVGEEFGSQILYAIGQSKISIPIISENYASSKWCLRELIHIMDRKKSVAHIVLPIFYKVTPSDVRHLKGNFGNAFCNQKHFEEKDIQEGQRALNEVSYLNGWECEKFANGYFTELFLF